MRALILNKNMRKIATVLLCLIFSVCAFGQQKPDWLDEDLRNMKFPANTFYTGFVSYELQGNVLQNVTEQATTEAQADLVKKIRMQISSKTQSRLSAISENGQYNESEIFLNQSETEANAEVVGIKTATYFDSKTNIVYAFAYANKYELIGYYKSNLSLNVNQIDLLLQTAQNLETNREKAKARKQLEMAQPLFSKVVYAQDMLTAIDGNATPDDLQQTKIKMLYADVTQMLARLAQAVYVYVESNENLFGQRVDIVANKLKAELAVNGCSFVENSGQADFLLEINVATRMTSNDGETVFCYADTQVKLYDTHKQKTVYSDEIAQKGGSNTKDKAGRKAMENVVTQIITKIINWIKN
jgi:hypothetical protein